MAGSLKLLSPKAFAGIISQYGLVPEPLLPVVAIGLPAIELVSGLCLLFDIQWSLEAIAGLLVFFILVLYYGVLNDLDIDCGCFSSEEIAGQNLLRKAIFRDFLMLFGVIYLFMWRKINGVKAKSFKEIFYKRR